MKGKKIIMVLLASLANSYSTLQESKIIDNNIKDFKVNIELNPSGSAFKVKDELKFVTGMCGTAGEIKSGSRLYGTYNFDFYIYQKYIDETDTMYYYALSNVVMESSKKTYWDQNGWFNRYAHIQYYMESMYANRVNYAPKVSDDDNRIVPEKSSLHIENEEDSEVYWYNSVFNSLSVKDNRNNTNINNEVTIEFNFERYNKNDKNDCSYEAVSLKSGALFEVADYSLYKNHLSLNIDFEGCIFRDGKINDSSVKGGYGHSFDL